MLTVLKITECDTCIKTAFKKFDSNNDGAIDAKELAVGLKNSGVCLTDQEIEDNISQRVAAGMWFSNVQAVQAQFSSGPGGRGGAGGAGVAGDMGCAAPFQARR